ncbi:MAG: hypothetical protein ABI317_05145 [Gaiellales bacterium]
MLEGYPGRTSGDVSVLGVDPARPDRGWRDRIGLVLQESELDPLLTVRQTLTLFSVFCERPRPIDEVDRARRPRAEARRPHRHALGWPAAASRRRGRADRRP